MTRECEFIGGPRDGTRVAYEEPLPKQLISRFADDEATDDPGDENLFGTVGHLYELADGVSRYEYAGKVP